MAFSCYAAIAAVYACIALLAAFLATLLFTLVRPSVVGWRGGLVSEILRSIRRDVVGEPEPKATSPCPDCSDGTLLSRVGADIWQCPFCDYECGDAEAYGLSEIKEQEPGVLMRQPLRSKEHHVSAIEDRPDLGFEVRVPGSTKTVKSGDKPRYFPRSKRKRS